MSTKITKAETCPNCDTSLNGENFCPNCGQKNDNRRLHFADFIAESLSHFFAFDGRLFQTLKTLVTSPGKVPLQYIQGKRMRYMNPLRLYFLSSLILLAILQFQTEDSVPKETEVSTSLARDTAIKNNANAVTDGVPVSLNLESEDEPEFLTQLIEMSDYRYAHPTLSEEHSLDSLGLPNTLFNRFLLRQSVKVNHLDLADFNNYLRSKLFWVLFLFLPITALLLKLLYVRRPFYYPEHLFFTFYNQSVFFILLLCSLILPNTQVFSFIAILIFGIYLLFAMKKFYQQGWSKTFFKFLILNIMIVPAFVLFFLISIFVVFILF